MNKFFSCAKIALFFIIVIAIIGGIGGYLGYRFYTDTIFNPPQLSGNFEVIEVQEGENLQSIAPKLQSSGLIQNVDTFRIYLKLESPDVNLQVGTYQIPTGLNVPELLVKFSEGPQIFSVTAVIPEGLRIDEVTEILVSAFGHIETPLFIKSEFESIVNNPSSPKLEADVLNFISEIGWEYPTLEGLLFPDTYNFGYDASASDVANLLVKTLMSRLEANGVSDSGRLNSLAEVINLASIVEREGTNSQDKRMISDIFLRRLETGYSLGADAPILYPLKRWSPPPTAAELQDDNPYNSRLRLGLPPTPIANPGIDAILGVLNPTSNEFLYFIHGSDGLPYYARTFSEHQNNISLYL